MPKDLKPVTEMTKRELEVHVNSLKEDMTKATEQATNADRDLSRKLSSIDDKEIANLEMQKTLNELNRIIKMMSAISKASHETAMAAIRNMRA